MKKKIVSHHVGVQNWYQSLHEGQGRIVMQSSWGTKAAILLQNTLRQLPSNINWLLIDPLLCCNAAWYGLCECKQLCHSGTYGTGASLREKPLGGRWVHKRGPNNHTFGSWRRCALADLPSTETSH